MIVGVTGHQERPGIDWTWVQTELLAAMEQLRPTKALTSLAAGTDQLFAAVALQIRCTLVSVIPFEGYDELLEGDARRMFRFLREASEIKRLALQLPESEAYLRAGQYVVDNCDVLFAVWDGKPAGGIGGTADIVNYARSKGRSVIWLEPVARIVRNEGGAP